MNDPAITLRDALVANWLATLTNPETDAIKFRVGEPATLDQRFMEKKISIELKRSAGPITSQTASRANVREIVQAHIWVKYSPETDAEKEAAFVTRQNIIDEISRVLDSVKKTLSGIRFAYQGGDIHMDSLPILHSIINVRCSYHRP